MAYNLVDPNCKGELDNDINYQLFECNNEYDLYFENSLGEDYVVPKDVFAFLFGDPKDNPRAQVYRKSKIKTVMYQDKDTDVIKTKAGHETLLSVYVLLATNKYKSVAFVCTDALTEQRVRVYLDSSPFGFATEQVDLFEYCFDFKEFKTKIQIVREMEFRMMPNVPEYVFKYREDKDELCFTCQLPGNNVPKSDYIHMYEPGDLLRGTKFKPFNAVPITKPRGDIHIVSQGVTPDVTLDDVVKVNYSDTHHTLYLTNSDLVNSKGTALYFPLLKFIESGNTICVSKEWTESMVELAKRSDRTITIVFE